MHTLHFSLQASAPGYASEARYVDVNATHVTIVDFQLLDGKASGAPAFRLSVPCFVWVLGLFCLKYCKML